MNAAKDTLVFENSITYNRTKKLIENIRYKLKDQGGNIMSNLHPITISSWTLGDQCSFEEQVQAAKKQATKESACGQGPMRMP